MKPLKTPISSTYDPYQLLRVYTYYRVLLSSLLLLLFKSNVISNALGSNHESLFFYTALIYTGINAFTLTLIWSNKDLPSQQQRFFSIFIDIITIVILMYASGGASSGLGYLLVVTIAAAGMLLLPQLSILMAAFTTIAIFSESFLRYVTSDIDAQSLFSAGTLGALLFVTVLSFQYLTRKILEGTTEAVAQAQHVSHLQKLARLIIERMYTGIIVLNEKQEIELINNSAKHLLSPSNDSLTLTIDKIPLLKQQLASHNKSSHKFTSQITSGTEGAESNPNELKFSITNLEMGEESDTLIFVEDNRAITQKAQQLKLASLGRFTASIAHEIRNPLGAISHANQLLLESTDLNPADQRLLEIIHTHTLRVNQIIENILQVSRRELSKPQSIELTSWVNAFLQDYHSGADIKTHLLNKKIITHCPPKAIETKFDASQLQQIIHNLLENALRYCEFATEAPAIILEVGINVVRETPFLKITDNGKGIDQTKQKYAFEPFFTTESRGTGLGLFICKELCEANHAYISYSCNPDNPSCFTIEFIHPEKSQAI